MIGAVFATGASSSDELLADELSSELLADELLESLATEEATRAARAGAGTVFTPGFSTSVCPCTQSTIFSVLKTASINGSAAKYRFLLNPVVVVKLRES